MPKCLGSLLVILLSCLSFFFIGQQTQGIIYIVLPLTLLGAVGVFPIWLAFFLIGLTEKKK